MSTNTLEQTLNNQGRFVHEIKGDELYVVNDVSKLRMVFTKLEPADHGHMGYKISKDYIPEEGVSEICNLGYGLRSVAYQGNGVYCYKGRCVGYRWLSHGNYLVMDTEVNDINDIELLCHAALCINDEVITWKGIEYHSVIEIEDGEPLNSPVAEFIGRCNRTKITKMVYSDKKCKYTVAGTKVQVHLLGASIPTAEFDIEPGTTLPIYMDDLVVKAKKT